jgi:hypothetical protein
MLPLYFAKDPLGSPLSTVERRDYKVLAVLAYAGPSDLSPSIPLVPGLA